MGMFTYCVYIQFAMIDENLRIEHQQNINRLGKNAKFPAATYSIIGSQLLTNYRNFINISYRKTLPTFILYIEKLY